MTQLHQAIGLGLRTSLGQQVAKQFDDGRPIDGTRYIIGLGQLVGFGATPSILKATVVNYPHVLVKHVFFQDSAITATISTDVLISGDVRTDAAAAIRDRHLSGITASTGGFFPNATVQEVAVGRRVMDWLTVYKFLVFNNSGANRNFSLWIQVIPLCAK